MHDQLATYVQVCTDVKYIPDHIATHSYGYICTCIKCTTYSF